MTDYFMDDIIIGLFYFFPEDKNQFNYDRERVHKFFHEQKNPILKDILFREQGMFPESQEIDQAYSNLTSSGLLFSWGTNFNPHEVSKECKQYFEEKIKSKFSEEDLKDLEELSEKFRKEFF